MSDIKNLTNTLLRKLNDKELFFYIAHKHLNSVLTPYVHIRVNGTIDHSALRKCLDYIQMKYQILQACIKEYKHHLHFAKLEDHQAIPRIPLHFINRKYPDQWKEICIQEINTKIESENVPLIKVFLLSDEYNQEHDLVVMYHHSIGDIESSITFFNELLLAYCKIKRGILNNVDIQNIPISNSSLDPVILQYAKLVDNSEKPSSKKLRGLSGRYFSIKNIWFSIVKKINTTQIECAVLDKQSTANLLNYCSIHHISVNDLLWALYLSYIKNECHPFCSAIIPINSRRFYSPKITNEVIGCYIDFFRTRIFSTELTDNYLELAEILNNKVSTYALPSIFNSKSIPKNTIAQFIFAYLLKFKLIIASMIEPMRVLLNHAGESTIQNEFGDLKVKAYNWGAQDNTPYGNKQVAILTIIMNHELNITLQSNTPSVQLTNLKQSLLSKLTELASNHILK